MPRTAGNPQSSPTKEPIAVDSNLCRKVVERYRSLPHEFCREWLCIEPDPWPDDLPPNGFNPAANPFPLWSRQREIMDALLLHHKVAAKTCYGVGKTYLGALLTLMFLYAMKALVITTGTTGRQIRTQLWQELHGIFNNAQGKRKALGLPLLGGKLNQTELQLAPKWYAMGFSTDQPVNLRGFHEERLLLIVDEADGVPVEMYEEAQGIMTSQETYVLLIGNPINPNGYFAECFKPGSGFHQITISALDSPNIRHGRAIYPKLNSVEWIRTMQHRCRPTPEEDPRYQSRVLAQFPAESSNALIPYRWIEAAMERTLPENSPIVSYGMDVARQGGDRIVLGRRQANGRFRIVFSEQRNKVTESAGHAAKVWTDECGKETRWDAPVNVDDIGVGGGVTDILEEDGVPVNGINVAESPKIALDAGGERPEAFENSKAQYYWRLRQAFLDSKADIDDDELAEELMKIQYGHTRKGKIKITEKDEVRKLLGRSPDKAESMMLAWAEDEAPSEEDLGAEQDDRREVRRDESRRISSGGGGWL